MTASLIGRLRAAALVAAIAIVPAAAQDLPRIDAARGALLIHGNFCGPGNRGPGYPPVDALDAACMRHDACTPLPGNLPHCACRDRLHVEAGRVAHNPATPRAIRDTAQFISDGALLLPCLD